MPIKSSPCRCQKTDWWSVFLRPAFVLAVVLMTPAIASAQPDGRPVGEVEATRLFCTVGVEAALVAAQADRGDAGIVESEVLPNPTLRGSHARVFGGVTEHETVVGLGIPLGIGGRRFVLQDVATARRQQIVHAALASRMNAAVGFRRVYVDAATAKARLAVEAAHQARYRELLSKLVQLEKGGEATAYDRRRLRTEAELHLARMTVGEAELVSAVAWLEAMASKPIELSDDVSRLARNGTDDGGLHPRIASLRAEADVQALASKAARRRGVPDLKLFAGYRALADGNAVGHGLSLQLSVPLTFFDHGQGEARRAEARGAVARARASAVERDSQATRRAASARMQILERSVSNIDRALEDAGKTKISAERLYLAGEATLLAVLEAFERLRALHQVRVDALAAMASARLDVMRARGRFGDARLDAACGGTP
jgi:outer membrane protein, heavy metal efflux system